MNSVLTARLDRSFRLTLDLAEHLDDAAIELGLAGLPSNTIAAQFWCLVGARQSHLRAIEAGRWSGFACSLVPPVTLGSIRDALRSTSDTLEQLELGDLTEAQEQLAFALLEHEVQHHGQLIRYVYGNGLTFPASWTERYTV